MPNCPRCSHEAPAASRFCPHCAHALGPGPTLDATRTSAPTSAPRPASIASPGADDESRFLPGTVLAGRYRVVGLLGRGGMGEVYRADDLKLGQSVALKFLPRGFEQDSGRLERFRNEVRLALRITHPNVCRVHDIGEFEGQHFISMEYVDGEDLASLLRRIGRLPEERGIEIARQICAGLAAAHEEGILHRDLKPANVMIDGRGRARITDFGLAGLSGTVEGDEARVGTPAYMAPEQLSGGEVTKRSEVYALGLVLYEIFTGKPAFAARSAADMARLQETSAPTTPTSHVRGLDPAIDAVLMRALETDPARRPPSAVAVAAALPGGDPLAAALAAGETPSPEMVAEAGGKGGIAPLWVVLSVIAVVAGVVASALLSPSNDALGAIDTPLSVAALHERARVMSERLGFGDAGVHNAHGMIVDGDYVEWLQEDERAADMLDRVAAGRLPVYTLWYRESPERLSPSLTAERVGEDDPPVTVPGMVSLRLDPAAQLVGLSAVPPDRDEAAGPADGDGGDGGSGALWATLFEQAGLDRDRFTEVEPGRTPPFFADARAAWEGTLAEAEDVTLRVEAAAFQGRPVSFRIIGPWTRDRGAVKPQEGMEVVLPFVFLALALGLLIGLGLLARRNLNSGRSDLRGARRVGLYIFVVQLASVLVSGTLFLGGDVMERVFVWLSVVVFLAVLVFLAYVALEPYVRRLWPATLISWTRVLAGRFADPLVGRDLLIGGVLGAFTGCLMTVHTRLPGLLGLPAEPLGAGLADNSGGALVAVPALLNSVGGAVGQSMLLLVALVLLRLLFRNTWVAIAVFALIAIVPPSLVSPHPALDIAVHAVVTGLTLFVTLRVGLLALISMWFFEVVVNQVNTLDPSSWVWETSLVCILALGAVTAYAAVVALGGRALLQDEV